MCARVSDTAHREIASDTTAAVGGGVAPKEESDALVLAVACVATVATLVTVRVQGAVLGREEEALVEEALRS